MSWLGDEAFASPQTPPAAPQSAPQNPQAHTLPASTSGAAQSDTEAVSEKAAILQRIGLLPLQVRVELLQELRTQMETM